MNAFTPLINTYTTPKRSGRQETWLNYKSSFRNMFLSLSLICLTVALLLAQVNKMTATPIAEAKAMKLQNAISEVPAFR